MPIVASPILSAPAPGGPPWHLLWLGLAGAAALMSVLWVLHLRLRNAAVVDLGWTVALGLLAGFYAWQADGDATRRIVVACLVGAWSLRLSLHLFFQRVWKQQEEGRYVELRKQWGARANVYLLAFFLGQAALAALLSLPFLLAASDSRPAPAGTDILAVCLFALAWVGESIADRQLARFKAHPENRGRILSDGLWGWSRHPNYFFEWLIWCSYALLALPAPLGWLGLLSPALLLFFILKVTGIPPTEAQALRSRGDAYRRYQQRTSAFVPWPPRKEGLA